MRFKTLLATVLATMVLLSGCRQTLYSGVTETDANEMLATLLKRGVDARKEDLGKGSYAISVDDHDMVRALDIIRENSLPRTSFQDLGQVFSGQSMISSQLEEQTRLAYGISQELSATFAKIDGVLDARVHVTLVQHEQSSGITTPPSAAVFLRHNPGSPVTEMISQIRETAAKSVPGLTQDRVSVMLEAYRERVIPPQVKVLNWYETPEALVGFGAAGGMVLTLLIMFVMKKSGSLKLELNRKKEEK